VSIRPQLVVLDFDGTLTRVEDEAAPFLEAYRAGLSRWLGGPIDEAWERERARVEASPARYGWEHDGRVVAPAHADPYILANTVAARVVREALGTDDASRAGQAPEVALEAIFREAYGRVRTLFRDDARAVLEALLRLDVRVRVVTNARTELVRAKLASLGADARGGLGGSRFAVHGDARKWMLVEPDPTDPRFAGLPDSARVEGLDRPVFLRRGRYYEVLRSLWDETGASPEDTLVCGDVFELDLAMPAKLGARVHLVGRDSTPGYEREAVRALGGSFSVELTGVLAAFA
jgi:FMN phosphatase YigB (HAD superfamily)